MQRDFTSLQPLLARLNDARTITDRLFDVVKPDCLFARPIAERHRLNFYIGHLEAFDWNLLGQFWFGAQANAPELHRLFAFGIDPLDGALPSDGANDWPTLARTRAYCRDTRAQLDALLADADRAPAAAAGVVQRAGGPVAAKTLLNVAIEHRLMHAETLAYMVHQLDPAQKTAPVASGRAPATRTAPHTRDAMLTVPAGDITLGLPADTERFGWDNEFGEQRMTVPAFDIDRHMVSNGDFLRFLNAGGYHTRGYWRDDDWAWREAHAVTQPAFWVRTPAGWRLRTMFGEVDLPHDWPVYVSHAEAAAYARYAGKALPSEAQWQRASVGAPENVGEHGGNFDFRRWDPVAVDAYAGNVSAFGVHGQYGNGWEWTSSLFEPLPGFAAFPFYPGYSANFFDGKHYVLKGGSARTAASMLRASFRNWFQPHYQYVYAGFRCVGA